MVYIETVNGYEVYLLNGSYGAWSVDGELMIVDTDLLVVRKYLNSKPFNG